MAIQVASLYGVLSLDDSGFQRKADDAKGKMRDLSGRLQTLGGSMQRLGGQMTLLTAPLALGLGVAINQTREFDRTMSNIFSLTEQTGAEADALRAQLLAIGADTVAGPQRVAEAYNEIASGVADASTYMGILTAAVATSEAGQADLVATTSALISTMNSYKLRAEDTSYVSDIFTRTVGLGVLSMDELASSLPQATGLAAQFDVGLAEVGGSLAYLTTQGFSASESATFLRGMMTSLLNPTADLEKVIIGLGYNSGQAMLESLGLVGAYQLLAQQPGGLTALITRQEALTGGLILSSEAANTFMADYVAGIDGATARAGAIQDQTEGWDKLRSKMEAVSILVGSQLTPVLLNLIDNALLPAITAVTDWAAANPELFNALVLVTGAAVLAGPVIAALGTAFKVVGVAIGLILTPAGLLITAIAGILIAANSLYPGGLVQMLTDAATAARTLATILMFYLSQAANWARARIAELMITLQNVLTKILEVRDALVNGLGAYGGAAQNAGTAIGMVTSGQVSVGDFLGALGNAINLELRADGGPVRGGVPYLVGEQGPELFVPSASGSIVPAGATAELTAGIQIGSVTIQASGYAEGRAAADGFAERLMEIRRRRG